MPEALKLQLSATSGDILDPYAPLIASLVPLSAYTRGRAFAQRILQDDAAWSVSLQGATSISFLIIQTNSPILVEITPTVSLPAIVPVSDLLVLSSRVDQITAVDITRATPVDTAVTVILLEQSP